MNEIEAIKSMRNLDDVISITETEHESVRMAISALEKQIPKKPIRVSNNRTDGCPKCKTEYYEKFKYCPELRDHKYAIEIMKQELGNKYISPRIKYAFEASVEVLEKQLNNGWIPCSERLPEEECNLYDVMHPCHRQFICTVKIGEYEPQTRQLFFSKVFGWKYGPEDYNDCVVAWQPLPEPYKEDSE